MSFGGDDIFTGVDVQVDPGERVAVVGRNGAGKTTLLRVLAGEIAPDAGKIVRSGVHAWLPQHAVSGSTRPLWDEAATGLREIPELAARMARVKGDVAAGKAGAIERLAELEDAFRNAGGYAVEERIGSVLHGLGFTPDQWQRPCDTFSGGWQMRIALARLLLADPDVLLLDEPTNHLDLQARSWLAKWLTTVRGAVVVVSHDRWLLERVAKRVWEVRRGSVVPYGGGIAGWLRERELARLRQEESFERQQERIAELERFVTRFKAKPSKASQARSRQNELDKMERVDAPEREERGPRLALAEAPPSSQEAVALRGVTVGWGDGPAILDGVDLTLDRGMRLAVLGPNGVGKSTLLAALSGELAPRVGRRILGKDVRFGLYRQDVAAALPAELSARDAAWAASPAATETKVRSVLGALGLVGDATMRPVSVLSGGERARVALATLVLRPSNVLLLDEPTNHLDLASGEALVTALAAFEGAMVLVTHDRWLVEAVATHVAWVMDGALVIREGVADLEPPERVAGPSARIESDGARAHEERRRRAREIDKAKRRIVVIERELPKLESRVAALLEAGFAAAADHVRARAIDAERAGLQAQIDALYAEWAELDVVASS